MGLGFMRVRGRSLLTLVLGSEKQAWGQGSLDHRVRFATGPVGPTPWTSLTGAVAAPAAFGVSLRLPQASLT
jgi:hypothetical protein